MPRHNFRKKETVYSKILKLLFIRVQLTTTLNWADNLYYNVGVCYVLFAFEERFEGGMELEVVRVGVRGILVAGMEAEASDADKADSGIDIALMLCPLGIKLLPTIISWTHRNPLANVNANNRVPKVFIEKY